MEGSLVVIFIGALVLLSHGFVAISTRTRVPDVLFLIFIGAAIGPVLHLISPDDFGQVGGVFTTIVLVLILFEGGLELNIKDLISSFREILLLTFLCYLISAVAIWLVINMVSEVSLIEGLFLAAVLAGPAPSVVIPLIRNIELARFTRTTLTTEAALGETLSILIALGIINWLQMKNIDYGHMVGTLLSSFALAVIIGIAGGFFWSLLLNRIRQLKNAMFMTPASAFIIYGICELIGYSGPVAALAFGVTLENITFLNTHDFMKKLRISTIELNEPEKLFLGEIVFLAKTFFFIYLGLSLQLTSMFSLKLAALITLALLVSRLFVVRFSIRKSLMPANDAGISAALIPKGLAAAVLANLFAQSGLETADSIKNIIYATIILSIVIASFLVTILHTPLGGKSSRILFHGFKATRAPEN